LLLVDQFEETFTQHIAPAIQERFISLLVEAVEMGNGVHVVLAMRADFYDQVLRTPRLGAAFDQRQFNVLPLSREELREAIENPALASGREFEAGLVERILDDIANEPGNLPLLQFALTELWEQQTAAGTLTHAAYDEIGGVQQALAGYAEQTFQTFSAPEQQQVRRILVQLVHPGEGREDTRRIVTRSALDNEQWLLVARLADTRLVVTGQAEDGSTETVQVAHEALIQGWQRLRAWVDADRTFLTWQKRLLAAQEQWKEKDQDAGLLLRGAALAEAEEWLKERRTDLNAGEQEYIDASIALREQETAGERRRQRLTQVAAVVFALLALLAGGAAWWAMDRQQAALVEAERAEQQATIAFSRQIAAQSVSLQENDPPLALLLAMQADAITSTFESRDSLMTGLQSSRLDATFFGHMDRVVSVAFSPDGQTLASASTDETIRLWDVATGQQIGEPLQVHPSSVVSVAFSPDGTTLASASDDQTIRLWDVATGQQIGEPLQGHTSGVLSVAFSSDGKTLVSASDDRAIRLWDVATGQQIGEPLQGHTNRVLSVAFSSDGKTLASASWDGSINLWDVTTGQPISGWLRGHAYYVNSVAFSPDGQTLASASYDQTIRLWDVATGQRQATLQGHTDGVRSVAFSPDGTTLASASKDQTIRLWDVVNKHLIATLEGHTSGVLSVAFSPDGQTLTSASDDNSIILWDMVSGERQATLQGHTNDVNSVAFSPDGQTLASASWDQTIILWDVSLDSWKSRACRVAGRNLTWQEWQRYLGNRPYERTCPDLPVHPSFIESGRALARAGDIDAAIARFEEALALDPDLDIDPEAEAQRLAAPTLLSEGRALAYAGDIDDAIAAYEQVQAMDSELVISADDWNTLCWWGSLWNRAEDVLDACEQAVALAEETGDESLPIYLDSRGLARALTGDYAGAVADFRIVLAWARENQRFGDYSDDLEDWIEALEAGRNPFDEETLESLREE
jgi:WD40 repeat protein